MLQAAKIKQSLLSVIILCSLYSGLCLAQTDEQKTTSQEQGGLLKQGSSILNSLGLGGAKGEAGAAEGDISSAFRQALEIGSSAVISQLGQEDGYLNDEFAHIPLPKSFKKVHKALNKIGLGQMTEDLEVSLNRAAEHATPLAKDLFVNAINEMSFQDIMEIYQGPDDAATKYFQSQMEDPLKTAMRPIVDDSLSEVGAIQLYDQAVSEYQDLPFVPKVKGDLTEHVLSASLDGIFHYLAIQEASIRQDPARHTTDLLKKVFGK